MAYEHKPGFGTVFRNKRKENEKQPDYRGEFMTPSGELLEVAMWVKEGAKGKYFSVKVQEPFQKSDDQPF